MIAPALLAQLSHALRGLEHLVARALIVGRDLLAPWFWQLVEWGCILAIVLLRRLQRAAQWILGRLA